MNDLETVEHELVGAKDELRLALLLAAGYCEPQAAEGDRIAADISRRVDSAFTRLTLANVLGSTAIQENHNG